MSEIKESLNFIEEIVEKDFETAKYDHRLLTRFPPEPNGYLHIGHAKSICLNFGLAQKYKGATNLRYDDTNPTAEDVEFVQSIEEDVKWLGFNWINKFYASNYFDKLYEYAVQLIKKGKAYVDDSTSDEIAALKGTPTEAGKNSPYRDRSVAENLALFERMKKGEFADGSCVLRAKIDMASVNMHMRDPILYRIKHAYHHQTGDKWCIYPMYDYAHPISDAIEHITHSVCTLEFEVHRPLYEWCIKELDLYPSQQIEFARLNLTYTVMSKRKLKQLVEKKYVNGWDDPRMPTISGLRRRGYTPLSIREFALRIGIAKRDNVIDMSLLEFCVREDLNKTAHRAMVVLNPLKLVITNWDEAKIEEVEIENNPENPDAGVRSVPFGRELWIEREDFMEVPSKKYFRLYPTNIVRLKGAYIVRCNGCEKDEQGNITQVNATLIENSRSGKDVSGLSPKGTLHWVSVPHAVVSEVRLYDRLFTVENPDGDKGKTFEDFINPNSLQIIKKAYSEPIMNLAKVGQHFQFLRHGYFCVDKDTVKSEHVIFNRTVTLRDNWAKTNK